MAFNNLGLGFIFEAKDLATSVVERVRSKYSQLELKLTDVSNAFEKAGPQLEGFANKLALLGAGGLAALGYAAHEASVFGKGIAEVSTLVDEAKFSTDQLYDTVINMGLAYGGDLAVQTKALYQGISAGAGDAASATNLLTAANKLAIGGVTDTTTAVDGLTNVLNSYSLGYEHAGEVSDAFFVALKSGKTTAAELGATVGRLAPTAVSVGIGFDEMLASISAVTTKGLKTEEAVNGLKAALSNVIKPTSDATAEAARLGIKFDAATLRSKGFKGFLDSITGSAKFNKDSMAKLFGSVEALNSVLALTANGGEAFGNTLDSMANKAGETDHAFEKMSDTAAFQQQRFVALRQAALVLIGEAVAPLTRGIQKFINAVIEGFIKLPKSTQKFLVSLALLASSVAFIIGSTVAFKLAWLKLAPAITPILTSIGSLLGGLLWPILLIGLAMAGLYVMWENNLGGIQDLVKEAWATISTVGRSIVSLFSSGKLTGPLLAEFQKLSPGLQDFVITIFLWGNRIKGFFGGVIGAFQAVLKEMEPQLKVLVDAFRDVGKQFGIVGDGADQAKSKFAAFVEVGKFVGTVLGLAFGVLVAAVTLAAGVITGVISGIKSLFFGLLDVVNGVVDIIGGILTGNWALVWQGCKKIVFGAIDAIAGVMLSLIGVAAKVADAIGGIFGKKLNLQSSIEGFKANLSKESRQEFGLSAPSPPTAVNSPAVAQTGAQAQSNAALVSAVKAGSDSKAAAPAAQQGPQVTNLVLDGEVLATAVTKHQAAGAARGFVPQPTGGA